MNELMIHLDTGGESPLYEQIYTHIRRQIECAQIEPGEKLPSSRALSAYLQVSRSTVDMAYGQLAAEGYVEARPCRGYFVCGLGLCQREEHSAPSGGSKAAGGGRKPGQAADGGCLPGGQEGAPGKYRYDFTPNGIDLARFPMSTWRRLMRGTLNQDKARLLKLGDAQGDWGLRETLSEYLSRARGISCSPERIVLGAGNDYLLMLLTRVMGIGTRIAMETYTYRQAYRTFCALGVPVEAIPMDEGGMCVEALDKSGANLAYVMPSHQFPVGTVMPVKRRLALLDWANGQEGRYIIEDDYDSEFRYGGRPVPALQGYDRQGRVIYMGTLSKSVAPAIRISYLVLPEPLLEVYRQKASFLASTVSRIDQMVLDEFFRDGYYERHLSRMRAAYKRKRDVLISCLRASFGEGCRISGEEAGIHLLAAFSLGQEAGELRRRAQEGGIRLYALSEYRIAPPEAAQGKMPEETQGKTPEAAQGKALEAAQGKTPEAILLLGYAHMEEAEIGEAVRELGRLLLG